MAAPKYEIQVTGKGIPDDEPLFLIRSQDIFGPDAVDGYAELLEIEAQAIDVPGEVQELREQANQARAFALAMRRWQAENPARVKRPD